jgi:predicted dehydrogenase
MSDHVEETPQSAESTTRRDFLKVAGTVAVGVAAAKSSRYSLAASRVIGANDRINIGHIGIGGQGNAHLRTLRGSRADLNHMSVAVCDLYQRRLEGARNSIDAPENKAYHNYEDLLADKDVDVVWIAVPEHWHHKIAVDSVKAGKDVYLEKPMTRHLDEAIDFYKLVKGSDRIVQIGSQGCSDSTWHTAGEIVKSGKIGKMIWSQASYCRNNPAGEWNYSIDPGAGPNGTGADHIDWDRWLGPAPKKAWNPEFFFRWRKYWDYSTGILNDLFPHRLNPMIIALGYAGKTAPWPKRVTCVGGKYVHKDDREVADTTIMTVDYPEDFTVVVAGSTENEQGLADEIRGQKATLFFSSRGVEIRPEQPFADQVDAETAELITDDDIKPGESIDQHERNFLRCVRSRKQPNCPVDLAAPVQVALCMAEMAYKQNKQVQFNPTTMKVEM